MPEVANCFRDCGDVPRYPARGAPAERTPYLFNSLVDVMPGSYHRALFWSSTLPLGDEEQATRRTPRSTPPGLRYWRLDLPRHRITPPR